MDKPLHKGQGTRLREIIEAASAEPALPMAVVHPVDAASIAGAARAADAGLIEAMLVGPEGRLRRAAEEAEVDIDRFSVLDTEHSHESARRAVELVRSGEARALLKGKLHYMAADDIAPLYPRWDDFQRVRGRLDPKGVFANAFLAKVLGPVQDQTEAGKHQESAL